jgi:hypothetical protein
MEYFYINVYCVDHNTSLCSRLYLLTGYLMSLFYPFSHLNICVNYVWHGFYFFMMCHFVCVKRTFTDLTQDIEHDGYAFLFIVNHLYLN